MAFSRLLHLLLLLAPSLLLPPTTSAQFINLIPKLQLPKLKSAREARTFPEAFKPSTSRPPVTFSLTFSYGALAPDNFIQDSAILTNGVFPGPTIRVRPYDTLVLRVTNNLAHGIALHFHGIRNFGTPEADGVPHVTQDKILPGDTFQYVVAIGSQAGTFIYHLHTGLDSVWGFGPLIVDDAALLQKHRRFAYDFDYVFSLSQMWHNETRELERSLKGVPFEDLPPPASVLINGRSFGSWPQEGKTGLTPGYDSLSVSPGKTYRFRIIGFGTDSILSFSIEKHRMKIIEVDGIVVKPVEVERLEVNSGQRYSVLVKMDQEVDNYWVRSEMVPGPGPRNGRAIIHYDQAEETSALRMTLNEGETEVRGVETEMWEWSVDLQPEKKLKQPSVYTFPRSVDREIVVRSGEVVLPSGATRFEVNGEVWASPKTPYLFQVRNEGINITKEPQVFQTHTNKVLQLVFQNVADSEGTCEQHPWHLHGHSFYVVGHGPGEYNSVVDGPEINRKLGESKKVGAVLRDVVTLCPSVLSAPKEVSKTTTEATIDASIIPANSTEAPIIPAISTDVPIIPAISTESPIIPEAPITPAASTDAPIIPATSTDDPIIPAAPTDAPIIPAAPTDAPIIPAAPTDAPIIPAISTDAPTIPAIPTDPPIISTTSTEAPIIPAAPIISATFSDTPIIPASSSDTPTIPASSSDTPTIPASSSDTPTIPASSSDTPTIPASSSDTPSIPASSSDTPTIPASSSDTPTIPASSSDTPIIPASSDNTTITSPPLATPPILDSSSTDAVNRTRRSSGSKPDLSSSESSEYSSRRSKKKKSSRRYYASSSEEDSRNSRRPPPAPKSSEEDSRNSRRPPPAPTSSEESDELLGDSEVAMEDHSLMRHGLLLEGLPPASGCGWVAVRFVTDNPGVWLVHCHLTAHLILGKQFVLYSYPKDNPRLLPTDS